MTNSNQPTPPAPPPGSPVRAEPVPTDIWEPPPPPPKARRPKAPFDRIKLLLVMIIWFGFSLWRLRQSQPALTFSDAVIQQVKDSSWLIVLAGIETIRQIHYYISEKSARYNTFWVRRVWDAIDDWKDRRDPWLRYRMAKYTKWGVAYGLFAFVLANRRGVSFLDGLAAVPSTLFNFLTEGPEQMPFWINILFPMFFIVGQFGLLFWFLSRGGVDVYMPEDITTSFDDVWGQDQVLDKVQENIVFLEDPRAIEEKGGHVPGGLLLWGPPGTGKTLMAEAVAGHTGKPYVFVDPGAFINMFMGVGIIKVKSLFRKLRKLSTRYGGVIVFFDEADSLGNRGALGQGGPGGGPGGAGLSGHEHLRWLSPEAQGELFRLHREAASDPSNDPDAPRSLRDRIIMGGMGGGGMGTLQALLTEISGLKKPRGLLNRYGRRFLGLKPKPPIKYRILIMMATNLPEALDGALLRPGRLDRIYKVGYPSKEGRKRTYEGYLKKVRHMLTDEQIDKLSVITPYATGATIKDLVNEALINAIRDDRDAVTWEDVIRAKHFKELGPSEDVEYIERERHAIAVHEACHAVAAYRVRHHMNIDLATIEKGGTYLGMVSSIKPEDQFTRWRTEYEADIIVSVASLAGERLFFDDDNSSGVSGDLEGATTLAALMEGFWGMGGTVSSHAVSRRLQIGGGGMPRPGEDDHERDPLEGALGDRIEANLVRLLAEAEELLRANRYEVLSVAHALETHKTLAGEDVEAVIEGDVGPLIDGRIYTSQEMRDQLDAYHELAAAAHRQHGNVEASLPALRLASPPPAQEDDVIDVAHRQPAEGDGAG
ncbi:MAG: AAA family ATPase [Acidimicrobiia bacterium]|nr:AAA family ATPase [Acidimicrobiia bacterium]